MELTLQTNITLPVDTVSVGNVMVFVYDADGRGGRLISRLANSSGSSRTSPGAQMVRQLRLEEANITLTSKITKIPTTNRSRVFSEFKIRLNRSTLYRHFFVIRKVLFVVTSYGQLGEADDHQNDQLFLISYTKSGVTSQDNKTGYKPPATEATTSGTGTKNWVVIGVSIGVSVAAILIGGCSVYWCYKCYHKRHRRLSDAKKIVEPSISTEERVELGGIINDCASLS